MRKDVIARASAQAQERAQGESDIWESGIWRQFIKRDPRAEWERHFNTVGLSLREFAGKEVLEVGPGATGIVYYLHEAKRRVGIDPAASGARKWNNDADGRCPIDLFDIAAESLPFPDASFDAAFCVNCLDHTTDPEAILAQIWRVLRPGGRFLIHFDIDSPLRKLHKWIHPQTGRLHPHSLTYDWTSKNILNNDNVRITATARDAEAFRSVHSLLYEAFWDNLIYRITGSKMFINHLWIAGVRR